MIKNIKINSVYLLLAVIFLGAFLETSAKAATVEDIGHISTDPMLLRLRQGSRTVINVWCYDHNNRELTGVSGTFNIVGEIRSEFLGTMKTNCQKGLITIDPNAPSKNNYPYSTEFRDDYFRFVSQGPIIRIAE